MPIIVQFLNFLSIAPSRASACGDRASPRIFGDDREFRPEDTHEGVKYFPVKYRARNTFNARQDTRTQSRIHPEESMTCRNNYSLMFSLSSQYSHAIARPALPLLSTPPFSLSLSHSLLLSLFLSALPAHNNRVFRRQASAFT